jgi:hypothetical protein
MTPSTYEKLPLAMQRGVTAVEQEDCALLPSTSCQPVERSQGSGAGGVFVHYQLHL